MECTITGTGLACPNLRDESNKHLAPTHQEEESVIMTAITLVVEFSIIPGNAGRFKELMHQAVDATLQKDVGALNYWLYFNQDETHCYSIETYSDTEAVLHHLNTVSAISGPLFEICSSTRFEIFGRPSPELIQLFAASSPNIYTPWEGFTRP